MRAHASSSPSTWWVVGGLGVAAALFSLASPVAASTNHHPKKPSATCLSATKLRAAVSASWAGPKVSPGLSPGQKLCNYTQSSSGETFLISHEALDGSTLKALARDSYPGTHFASVSVAGDKGLKGGNPGTDILLVQIGSQLYEFLDNSGMATTAQLEAVAKQVDP
jgi:hypothetical protein